MAPKTALERSSVRRPSPRLRSSSCSYALCVCVCITTVPALLSIFALSRAFLHRAADRGEQGGQGGMRDPWDAQRLQDPAIEAAASKAEPRSCANVTLTTHT